MAILHLYKPIRITKKVERVCERHTYTTCAFPPKASAICQRAGLLAFPIFNGLPIFVRQWLAVVEDFKVSLPQDYSYGDSAGFSPASLLNAYGFKHPQSHPITSQK